MLNLKRGAGEKEKKTQLATRCKTSRSDVSTDLAGVFNVWQYSSRHFQNEQGFKRGTLMSVSQEILEFAKAHRWSEIEKR